MPGRLNGIDLAEFLERFEPHIPAILVTGYAEELDRARQVDAHVLSKPFDIALLDSLLRAIAKARQMAPRTPRRVGARWNIASCRRRWETTAITPCSTN